MLYCMKKKRFSLYLYCGFSSEKEKCVQLGGMGIIKKILKILNYLWQTMPPC